MPSPDARAMLSLSFGPVANASIILRRSFATMETATTDSNGAQGLHPQRKRKFFLELADLLDEEPCEVIAIQDAFPGPERREPAAQQQGSGGASGSDESKSAAQFVSASSLASDSFDLVEFGATRTRSNGTSQSSCNDSMADSLLFLPGASSTANDSQRPQRDRHVHFQFRAAKERASTGDKAVALPVTTLVNTSLLADSTLSSVRLEMADYYDADRMCEQSPCWLHNDGVSCTIHRGVIRRPMLLFCLQVLDEFIACNELLSQQRWRAHACKVARRVFTAMWESDVLGRTSDQDLVLSDQVTRKEPGVTTDVWRVISRYWDKYKKSYLHQQELFFADATEDNSTLAASKWNKVRDLLQIYGMKPKQALRLIERQASVSVNEITMKQLSVATQGLPSLEHLRVGIEYLGCSEESSSHLQKYYFSACRRPVITQQDAKTAFRAILIHLKKWNDDIQVFPCGSFSRGAAFVSVLDILVAVDQDSLARPPMFSQVIAALTAAKVIKEVRPLSKSRGVCIVPFKSGSILLDLKVYSPPKSWIALLYFTGPESFVVAFFAQLLKRSLCEVAYTSFKNIHAAVAEVVGLEVLKSIRSEKDLFDIMDREYVFPSERL